MRVVGSVSPLGRGRGARWLCACALLVALAPGRAPAFAEARYEEAAVRAAMLVNLPKFIAWPQSTGMPVRLCVVEAPAVHRALVSLLESARSVGRAVTLEVEEGLSSSCSYVYAGAPLAEMPDAAAPPARLLVTERAGSSAAAVELVRRGERVVIRINHAALTENGFAVDARLLQLAEVFGGR